MTKSKAARDNRANQLNPVHPAYHRSRGADPSDAKRIAESHADARSAEPTTHPGPVAPRHAKASSK